MQLTHRLAVSALVINELKMQKAATVTEGGLLDHIRILFHCKKVVETVKEFRLWKGFFARKEVPERER